MNVEIIRLKGRLRDNEMKARELKLRIEGLRDAIRDQLDPYEKIENLKAHRMAGLAVDLSGLHIEYMELVQEIADIKRDLGES
jgi:metal-responsive CopG/Arc/MetJ family transcriptional regulator